MHARAERFAARTRFRSYNGIADVRSAFGGMSLRSPRRLYGREKSQVYLGQNRMNPRQLINRLLRKTKYRIQTTNRAANYYHDKWLTIDVEYILARELLRNRDFFFVQIGANDGVRCDDIYRFVTRHRLKGIVVEPLADMYAQLTENYRDQPQVVAVNAAIDRQPGTKPLYRIRADAKVPDWCHGIASFDRGHLLASSGKIPGIDELIVEEEVTCMTFDQLIEKCGDSSISLLQIDVEGFDFEVIKMIDFSRIRPAIIRYESASLSEQENFDCATLLVNEGYRIFHDELNMIAYLDS